MEENINIETMDPVDNTKIAESVSDHINFETTRLFLVKPLDPIMVKKEFSTPVSSSAPRKDENGIEATDYSEVKTEVKEVESDYRKGIVIKVPLDYQKQMESQNFPATPIHIGDTIIYQNTAGRWFDLLKDSQLVETYSIVAIEK